MLKSPDKIIKKIEDEQDRRINAMSCAAACMYIAAGVLTVCMVGMAFFALDATR